MRRRPQQLNRHLGIVGLLVLVALGPSGCGEAGSPLGPPDAGSAVDVGMAVDVGVADAGESDMAVPADNGTDAAGPMDLGTLSDSGGGGCPTIAGTYALGAVGPGCGPLVTTQTISQSAPTSCTVEFTTAGGLSGAANVASDGSFIGQTLAVGGTNRSCRGTWNVALAQFSVVCGSGPSVCNVTLD